MRRAKKFFWSSILVVIAGVGFNACSPASPKLKPEPLPLAEKVIATNNQVYEPPQVDILFVVDDSGSMGVHQSNLKKNMSLFVDEFTKLKIIDYHIGVTSSSINDSWSKAENGELSNIGGETFVTQNTPNKVNVLNDNLSLGTGGSATEKFFSPIQLALSLPLMDEHNFGFYRPSAFLAIVFLTDSDDQSKTYYPTTDFNATELMKFLTQLKKSDKSKIFSYGAIIPQGVTNCERSGEPQPARLEEFLGMTVNAGNNVISLCDQQFGKKIVEFAKSMASLILKPIFLNRPPVVDSIRVMYGTQEIPSDSNIGWSFQPESNSIVFGPNLKLDENQPEGTTIQVYFDSAYYPGETP